LGLGLLSFWCRLRLIWRPFAFASLMLPPVAWVRVSWQQQFGGSGSLANRPDRCHAPWPGFCRPLFLLIRLSCRCIHSCIHESQLSVLSVCVWMYKPMCGFPDPFPSFLRAPFSTLHLRVSRLSWHFLASPSNNKRCMWTPLPMIFPFPNPSCSPTCNPFAQDFALISVASISVWIVCGWLWFLICLKIYQIKGGLKNGGVKGSLSNGIRF